MECLREMKCTYYYVPSRLNKSDTSHELNKLNERCLLYFNTKVEVLYVFDCQLVKTHIYGCFLA